MPIDLFHIIEDGVAIIKQNGIFKQVKVYRRGVEIFVLLGTGYIRLMARGTTSVPSISWLDLDAKDVSPHENGSHRAGQPIYSPVTGGADEKK